MSQRWTCRWSKSDTSKTISISLSNRGTNFTDIKARIPGPFWDCPRFCSSKQKRKKSRCEGRARHLEIWRFHHICRWRFTIRLNIWRWVLLVPTKPLLERLQKRTELHFEESKAAKVSPFNVSITIDFEISILMFLRSLRNWNFKLYTRSLEQLLPLFFAVDHIVYARWLTVLWKDMTSLPETHPAIYEMWGVLL